jgi:hypothetical protein
MPCAKLAVTEIRAVDDRIAGWSPDVRARRATALRASIPCAFIISPAKSIFVAARSMRIPRASVG